METKNSNPSFSSLAEELILKIFLLLPVSSLVCLSSVCKLWCSIISSRRFVETHLINSRKNLPSLLTAFTYQVEYDHAMDVVYGGSFHNVYMNSHDDESVRIDLPERLSGTNRLFLVGSCDGLVCLVKSCMHFDDHVFLWNPLTKLFKYLPTPKKPSNYNLGFGFDSISGDYKILMIVCDNFFGKSSGFVAQLYSAKDDSWKEIEVPKTLESFAIPPYSKCVYVQPGALYFQGTDELLSFNLDDEVFGVYPYPIPEYNGRSNVLEFEGSAAMIFESRYNGPVLWQLENVNGDVSWTKKIKLEVDFKMDREVLYLGAGRFVVQADHHDECRKSYDKFTSNLIIYDHRKRETKSVSPRIPDSKDTSLIKYTESLISLQGFESEFRRQK
ncbi:putative F-box protein At5g52610 [Apium graveolens]|uniref:putative F-box protein At5g52610 n=1 Tax=Apium graveolens TaxID=4045 RepID=UPI003D7BEB49